MGLERGSVTQSRGHAGLFSFLALPREKLKSWKGRARGGRWERAQEAVTVTVPSAGGAGSYEGPGAGGSGVQVD